LYFIRSFLYANEDFLAAIVVSKRSLFSPDFPPYSFPPRSFGKKCSAFFACIHEPPSAFPFFAAFRSWVLPFDSCTKKCTYWSPFLVRTGRLDAGHPPFLYIRIVFVAAAAARAVISSSHHFRLVVPEGFSSSTFLHFPNFGIFPSALRVPREAFRSLPSFGR